MGWRARGLSITCVIIIHAVINCQLSPVPHVSITGSVDIFSPSRNEAAPICTRRGAPLAAPRYPSRRLNDRLAFTSLIHILFRTSRMQATLRAPTVSLSRALERQRVAISPSHHSRPLRCVRIAG